MSQPRPSVQPSLHAAPAPLPPYPQFVPVPANRGVLPLVLGVVALVAVAAVGGEILLLLQLRRTSEHPPQTPPQVVQTQTSQTSRSDPPRSETPRTDSGARTVVHDTRSDPQDGRSVAASAEPLNAQEPLVSALGGLTAAHLYQTYLNLGLLADGVEKEVYTTDQGKKVLEEITGLMDTVDRQLSLVPPAALKADDRKALERIRTVHAQLRTQARELREYWTTDDKEHAEKFQKARTDAWAGIKELLDIKD